MNLKNRKGSILALTIIIFAVLMIFATFTLGFMVTENKQAMYYQNKTQAYYYAVSGADVLETALIDQLTSYGNDIAGINLLLDQYKDSGYDLVLSINGVPVDVNVSYGKVDSSALNSVLIVESMAKYNDVNESVRKVLYSVANTISSNSQEIVYEGQGQFLIYKSSGLMHHNQTDEGGNLIPSSYARQATNDEAENFIVQDFPIIEWNYFTSGLWDGGLTAEETDILWTQTVGEPYDYSIDSFVLYSPDTYNYGEIGKTTNVYVDGNLNLSGKDLTFNGKVNLIVKGNMTVNSNVTINSGKTGDESYLLNTYIYNLSNEVNSLRISTESNDRVSNVELTGNYYIDYVEIDGEGNDIYGTHGDINLFFHQDVFIDGNIIYNGTGDLKLKTQPNNLNSLSKIISGSIYAPYGNVILGDETDKVAFLIDGVIFADTIEIFAKNNAQVNKFFTTSFESGIGKIPVITNAQVDEISSIVYGSYYTD